MAKDNPYFYIVVESFIPENVAGLHGTVHIRPVHGGDFSSALHVECSKALSEKYPIGTRFKIRAKLTDREGGGEYLYSHYKWPYEVIE